jgi:hypothetical protein
MMSGTDNTEELPSAAGSMEVAIETETEVLTNNPIIEEKPAAVSQADSGFLVEEETDWPAEESSNQGNDETAKEDNTSTLRFTLPDYPSNAQQEYPVDRDKDGSFKVNLELTIPLPSHHIDLVNDAVLNIGAEFAQSDEGREWAANAIQSRPFHPRAAGTYRDPKTNRVHVPSALSGSASRESAEWVQLVNTQKGKLGPIKLAPPPTTGKVTLTGDAAVNSIRSLIGMGDKVKIPLWHSGIWVTIKAPVETDLLDFLRRISQEKINLGRTTTGAIFSNLNVVVAEYYRNFIAEYIVESSYYNLDKAVSRILAPDLDHLVWGLACAVYPHGFDYARSVISPNDAKKRVVRDRINLAKIQWVDRRSLTEYQLNHMGSRANGSMSEASVNRYQEELMTCRNRTVQIETNNGSLIDLDLKIPTLDEYIEIGNDWINNIIAMVDRTLGSNATDATERAKAVNEQGLASYLQMYSHWINRLAVGDSEVYEKEAIGKILGTIGSSEKIRRAIVKEITRFIDDSVVSMIALPALTDEEAAKYPRFVHLVPLNVLHVFFILLVQKVNLLPQDEVV